MTPKKRMMFMLTQDYYLMTYSIILLLQQLSATTAKTSLIGLSKMNILVELISNNKLLSIIETTRQTGRRVPVNDLDYLDDVYHGLISREPILYRVFFILSHRKIISIEKAGTRDIVFLKKESINDLFFDVNIFSEEIDNIKRIRTLFPHVKRMTKESLLQSIFIQNGVLAWEI